jgi:hypothetical protein
VGATGAQGPAGPPAFASAVLASDFSSSLNTPVDTGLAFVPTAGKVYEFVATLLVRTAVAGTGPRTVIAWPSAQDGAVVLLSSGLLNNTQSWPVRVEGILVAGMAPAGSLRVQLQSETAGTLVTVKAGSFLSWREVS